MADKQVTSEQIRKLRELIQGELDRIGVSVKLDFPVLVEFRSPSGRDAFEMTPGTAIDFLKSIEEGQAKTYKDLLSQYEEFTSGGEEEEDDEEDEDDDESDEDDDE